MKYKISRYALPLLFDLPSQMEGGSNKSGCEAGALWDIDLASFGLEIVLNRRIAPAHLRKFEFVERESPQTSDGEPGLQEFLKDRSLNGGVTLEEVEFLKQLRSKNRRRPTALYNYRELQNLRDPLHFRQEP